jgi:hypothetical protein
VRKNPATQRGQARWYGQRVIWLGALIFIALFAGCIALIVVATRYPDDTLPTRGDHVLKVPTG